jgi:IMP dehydrogenase
MAVSKKKRSSGSIDDAFYLKPDAFFRQHAGTGLTYDDVSLATLHSDVLPRETRLDTALSEQISLSLPVVSSDMDTVTEHQMAIAMALNGGLGLLHYNMSEADQLREVQRVKNHIHGMIADPATVTHELRIGDVLARIERDGLSFSTFPVVDKEGVLLGLLPGNAVKDRHRARLVRDAMIPAAQVLSVSERELGKDPIATADRIFSDRVGLNKLLVVDGKGRLRGLFTLSDIERIADESRASLRPTRDAQFRLRVGAAVSVPRDADGALDSRRLLAHVGTLVDAGLDACAVSTAHGFSRGVGEGVRALRKAFPRLTLIAGNVTSGDGVEFLAEAGADAIKVGQGPGSICTTRIVAGVGIPQLTALYVCSVAARKAGVRLLADGGISKSGDIVKALALADGVILGGLLAGCREAPGKILEINGKTYKEYRGMGSLEAMRQGSAARYGHGGQGPKLSKVAPEGIEALKEVSGTVDKVLGTLCGGVQSGLGYLGARDLNAHRNLARFIRVSPAGQRESAPHDVIEIKAGS